MSLLNYIKQLNDFDQTKLIDAVNKWSGDYYSGVKNRLQNPGDALLQGLVQEMPKLDEQGNISNLGFGMGGIVKSTIKNLPQSLIDIGESGRWDAIQRGTEGKTHLFDIVPENTQGLEKYYGKELNDIKRNEGYFNPLLAKLKEDNEFGPTYRHAELLPESGLTRELPATKQEGVLYRGMSQEEYDEAIKRGFFESKGDMNFEGQQGTTSYTTDPSSAESYANWYAPTKYKPAPGKNAYVVGIKDPGTSLDIEALRNTHERSVPGRVSIDDITEVYEGVPYGVNVGKTDVIDDYGLLREGSSVGVSSDVGWRKLLDWRNKQ